MKFLALLLVCVGCFAFAEENLNNAVIPKKSVGLMDNTNPDNLAACLAPISFTADASNAEKTAKVANGQVWACVKDSVNFGEKPSHFDCRKAAQKIKSDNNLKQDIYKFCNENYFQTMTCVKEAKLLKEKLVAAQIKEISKKEEKSGSTEIAKMQNHLNKTVRDCVLDNTQYFDNDFCIRFIKDAGMLEDKELSQACLNEAKKASAVNSGDSQH